jgi:FkbM family methyltransferase
MYRLARIAGHTFVSTRLGKNSVVVDLGANRGEFSLEAAERFGCLVYSIEASPRLVPELPAHPRIRPFGFAVSGTNGPVEFFLADNPQSSSVAAASAGAGSVPVRVEGKMLETFLDEQQIAHVDLLKMDVEGAEKGVFETASDAVLNRIDQITIEFHDFTGAMTAADVWNCVRRLRDAGFTAVQFSRSHMDWLFYRADRCGVGPVAGAWMRHVHRHLRFVARNTIGRLRHDAAH